MEFRCLLTKVKQLVSDKDAGDEDSNDDDCNCDELNSGHTFVQVNAAERAFGGKARKICTIF